MKVKKFPQSHLVITNDQGKKLIIDPGYLTYEQGFKVSDFQGADVYLITHQHADHLDPQTIKEVIGDKPIYGNSDVVAKLKEVGVMHATEVNDRLQFESSGFKIIPVDLPHCKMQDGSDGPPNTGFVVDGVFFHPGDGDKNPGHVTVDNLALPIAGPSITLDGALQFAKDLKAKLVIPIHYDSRFTADPLEFKKLAEQLGIEVRPLYPGEETEI